MKKKLTVNTLAVGNLKNRKRQYISLITGIVLAMVFSSSILLVFSSMIASIRQQEKDLVGNQNGIYIHATQQMFAEAAGDQVVGDYAFARIIGEVFTESETAFPVAAYDDKAKELANIQFIAGAYPQNEDEIAIERSTLAKLGTDASVGDSITLRFSVQNGDSCLPRIRREDIYIKRYRGKQGIKYKHYLFRYAQRSVRFRCKGYSGRTGRKRNACVLF